MTNVITLPSTVDGIKRLAKTIKRDRSIPHSEALNEAAKQAGFDNFRHAQNVIAKAPAPQRPRHKLFLTVHWLLRKAERGSKQRLGGREMLEVDLQCPLPDMLSRHQVRYARNLTGFRMEYSDHLEGVADSDSLEDARERLLQAARTIRFIEATGLRPATNSRQRESICDVSRMPARDHQSSWFDPESGESMVLDEPYEVAIHRAAERDAWAKAAGFTIVRPQWAGLYAPGFSIPFFVSRSDSLLKRIAAVVEAMATTEDVVWPETGMYGDYFVSSARKAAGTARKPRPGKSYGESNGAVPYGGGPGVRSSWRPANPMPIEAHRQVGGVLQSLAISSLPWNAYSQLRGVASRLEDWAYMEHDERSRDEHFDTLYYGGRFAPLVEPAAVRKALAEAKAMILEHYGECKPKAEVVASFDKAINVLETRTA